MTDKVVEFKPRDEQPSTSMPECFEQMWTEMERFNLAKGMSLRELFATGFVNGWRHHEAQCPKCCSGVVERGQEE